MFCLGFYFLHFILELIRIFLSFSLKNIKKKKKIIAHHLVCNLANDVCVPYLAFISFLLHFTNFCYFLLNCAIFLFFLSLYKNDLDFDVTYFDHKD